MTKAREIAELGQKLTVDASGNIDVAGSVTSDNLIVDNGASTSAAIGRSNGANDSSNLFLKKGYNGSSKLDFLSSASDDSIFRINVDDSENVSFDWDYGSTITNDKNISFTSDATKTHLNISTTGDISFYDSNGSNTKFFWDASGEVLGLGTANPNANSQLHLDGGAGEGSLRIEGDTNTKISQFAPTTGANWIYFGDTDQFNSGFIRYDHSDDSLTYKSKDYMKFTFGSIERVRITNDGDMGIGTSVPGAKLNVRNLIDTNAADGTGVIKIQGAASNYAGYIGMDSSTMSVGTDNASRGLSLVSGGSERARITPSGNFGIGNDNPTSLLQVSTTSTPNALIESTSTSGQDAILRIRGSRTSSTSGEIAQIRFETNDNAAASDYLAFIMAGKETANTNEGILRFGTTSTDGGTPSERMRITSAGRVGIGIQNAKSKLDIAGDGPHITITDTDTTSEENNTIGGIKFYTSDGSGNGPNNAAMIQAKSASSTGSNADIAFSTKPGSADGDDATETMRLDHHGNLKLGDDGDYFAKLQVNTDHVPSVPNTTSGGWNFPSDSDGLAIYYTGLNADSWGGKAVGGVYSKYKTASTDNWCGFDFVDDRGSSSGTHRSALYVRTRNSGSGDRAVWKFSHSGSLFPLTDNAFDLGAASLRLDDIYATNSTIQTSDENEKQQIASLTDAEMTAAKAISKLFKTFKWNSAVEAKGAAARTHSGVIAQQVEQAMTDAGLDADDYAFFVRAVHYTDTVEGNDLVFEYDDDERTETATKHEKLAIRYPELLSFIGAATEQRLTSIESRLDALEAT